MREMVQFAMQANASILNAQERCEADLHFNFNGGVFKATETLIGYLYAVKDDEPFVHNDVMGYPVYIDDPLEFFHKAKQCRHDVLERFLEEYKTLRKIR